MSIVSLQMFTDSKGLKEHERGGGRNSYKSCEKFGKFKFVVLIIASIMQ